MKEFERHLNNWQGEKLTEAEKARMLQNIFSRPVASPYARYLRVFAYIQKPAVTALALFLVLGTGVVSASQRALPGEKFYAVKTKVVEPLVGAFHIKPEEKLDWAQEKVERRIEEAKTLAAEDKLDEDKTEEIEQNIEKSSAHFNAAAEEISKKSATTTEKQEEKKEELKKRFREKLEMKQSDDQPEREEEGRNGRDKIERLKDHAIKALEQKDEGED